MASGLGADAHSDGSADSVELPPGMLSECPNYPRSIDAIPGRTMVNYRITSELSGVFASSPAFAMTGGPPSRRPEHNFVMTKSDAGVAGLLLCK